MKRPKYLIGIDEAGRGPLAGPVAVGVVLVTTDFDWRLLAGVGDSKKVSPKNREAIFGLAQVLKKNGLLNFSVIMVSAKVIDKIGIVPSINRALSKALEKVIKNQNISKKEILVKLDGGLKAPAEYLHQETIIKGDAKEKIIGLASILAKVTRDKYMEKLSQKSEFAKYNFATHKGYGTKSHREAIAKYGLSSEHRQTFCRNIKVSRKGLPKTIFSKVLTPNIVVADTKK